jgi:uncharacterized membrane protein YvbJ
MALINCPECGTEVSDKADKCPKCAYPIKSVSPNSTSISEAKTEVIVRPKEGCFLQTLNAGCMFIAIIIVLIILVAIFSHR